MKRLLCIGANGTKIDFWYQEIWYYPDKDVLKTSKGEVIEFRKYHTMVLYEAINNNYFKVNKI